MKAFISYSHRDAELLDRLHEHLAALRREGLLETWTDREIHAGGEIDGEIDAAMDEAELFLLLISASFLNSSYCYETEFRRAQQKQEEGRAIIVPLILREVDWEIDALRKHKALPDDGKPVVSRHWHSEDEGFSRIAMGLRKMLTAFTTESRASRRSLAAGEQIHDSSGAPTNPPSAHPPNFGTPGLELAVELLEKMRSHPEPTEWGLTEILQESPSGPLDACFIPNITARGAVLSARKRSFQAAVAELMHLGWLLPPETGANVRIYEMPTAAVSRGT